MTYYLQSTSEENLYICILSGLWGSKNSKLTHWKPNDKMIIYVGRELAALFTITSEQFEDETPNWTDGLYPYRVNVSLEKIVHPEDRYSISNPDTREILFKHHTTAYGVVTVLNATPLDEAPAKLLLQHLEASPSWEGFDAALILEQLNEEPDSDDEEVVTEVIEVRPESTSHGPTGYTHTQIQYHLAKLGKALGFDIWIPKNDQARSFQGERLSLVSLSELPVLPFDQYVKTIISNIDVIWLNTGNPSHIFEVERTTSIYSGLLRMADLATLIPMISIQMFICASEVRRGKVFAEVTRPMFSREPLALSRRCRFIPFESLVQFVEVRSDILSDLRPSILNRLSEPIEH